MNSETKGKQAITLNKRKFADELADITREVKRKRAVDIYGKIIAQIKEKCKERAEHGENSYTFWHVKDVQLEKKLDSLGFHYESYQGNMDCFCGLGIAYGCNCGDGQFNNAPTFNYYWITWSDEK